MRWSRWACVVAFFLGMTVVLAQAPPEPVPAPSKDDGKSKMGGNPPPVTPPPVVPAIPPAKSGTPPAKPDDPKLPFYPTEVSGRTLEQWIKEIENPDPSVREQAIRTVLLFGPNSRRAIPALVKQVRMLNDLNPQANAIIALGELIPVSPEYARDAVDALTVALDSTQGIIRYRAAMALAPIGANARAAVPKLVSRVNDRASWEIRKAVCLALGWVGRDEQGFPDLRALTALVDAVDDPCKEVRLEALQSIINLGPPAVGNISQIKTLLERRLKNDKDKSVVIWVRVALMRLDGAAINEANLGTIAKQMSSTDLDIRIQAAKALGYVGELAKSKFSDLVEMLKDPEPLMVLQVCWSIGRMGQYAEKAIPSLETLSTHKEEAVRLAAKTAIEEIKKAIETAKKNPPKKP